MCRPRGGAWRSQPCLQPQCHFYVGHTHVYTLLTLSETATTLSKSNIGYVTFVVNTHQRTRPVLCRDAVIRTMSRCVSCPGLLLLSTMLQRCTLRVGSTGLVLRLFLLFIVNHSAWTPPPHVRPRRSLAMAPCLWAVLSLSRRQVQRGDFYARRIGENCDVVPFRTGFFVSGKNDQQAGILQRPLWPSDKPLLHRAVFTRHFRLGLWMCKSRNAPCLGIEA